MAIDYKCLCGEVLSFANEQAGFEVECPHCANRILLPTEYEDLPEPPRKRSAAAGVAAGVVVLAIVVAGLVLGLGRKEALPAATPEIRLIPADAVVVAGANVWRIVRLDALQEALAALDAHEGFLRLKQAGFRWEGVETIHLAVGAQVVDTDEPEVLVLLRSRESLPLSALAEAAAEAAQAEAVETEIGGRKGYSFRMQREEGVAVLLEDRLLAAGSPGMVAKAVALADGQGESVASNARLMDLARGGVRPEMVWLAADLPADRMAELQASAPMLPFKAEDLRGLLAHFDYAEAKGLTVGATLLCKDEQAAKQALPPLEAMLRAFGPMALQVDQDAFSFATEGARVNMQVVLPDEALRRLAEMAEQHMAREHQAAELPEWVLEAEQTLISAEAPFEERTFKFAEIKDMPMDPETGYRRIEGQLWASPLTCASSEQEGDPHRIPLPPRQMIAPGEEGYGVEEEAAKPYPCPVCGKEANPEVVMEQ